MKLKFPVSIPRVNECCFCINLRTGSLTLGWFGVIVNILGLLGLTVHLIKSEELLSDLEYLKYDVEEQEKKKGFLLLSFAVFAFMCLMDLFANALLVFGIYKKRPSFISQWLLSSIMWFLLAVIGQLFRILSLVDAGSNYFILIHAFVLSFFCFGLRFYWWLSVYSLYDLVKSGKPLEKSWEEVDVTDDEERAINQE